MVSPVTICVCDGVIATARPWQHLMPYAPLLPASLRLGSRALLWHSPSYLVGVICLGVDKHPPTSFLVTPVSTHRCLRKGTTQASPSAFKVRLRHLNFGLRQPWVQIPFHQIMFFITLNKSFHGISFASLIYGIGEDGIPQWVAGLHWVAATRVAWRSLLRSLHLAGRCLGTALAGMKSWVTC